MSNHDHQFERPQAQTPQVETNDGAEPRKEGAVTQVTEAKPEAAARPVIDVTGKRDIIEKVIEDIRPTLQRDGGDCELVGIEDNRILVKMKGACIGCQLSSLTLQGVQAKIMAAVGVPVRVIPVQIVH